MAVVYRFKCIECGLVFHKKYFFDPDNRTNLPCPLCKNILDIEITFI
jgi:hypothetical protein